MNDKNNNLKQLYVSDTVWTKSKALARLRQQEIKVVVTNILNDAFAQDEFLAFCIEEHKKDRLVETLDEFCERNLESLIEKYNK